MKILSNDFHRREADRLAGEAQIAGRKRLLANVREWSRLASEALLAGNYEVAAARYAQAAALLHPQYR